jgi:superfamily II DNA or RNA helicase
MKALDLPQVEIPPVSHALGQIRHVMRPAETVAIQEISEIRVSPRVSEKLCLLASGEKVVLTDRRNITRPDGVDGVLRHLGDGTYQWASHRLTDDFLAKVTEKGWKAVAEEISASWNGRFAFRAEDVEREQQGLRPPQLGALHAIGAHWSLSRQTATIVMPTGTGKTETMLATLAAYVRGPLLVVVPWDLLRGQTARKFLSFGLLRQLKVLAPDVPNPIVGIMTRRPASQDELDFFESCNVIISTMSSLSGDIATALAPDIAGRVDTLILDEAHHVAAASWSGFRAAFSGTRVLQFTATPLRRDKRLVEGSVIYNYPLRSAQRDGYFKKIAFEPVYSLDQAGADTLIAETALARLRADIETGLDHILMARCANITRAAEVFAIYRRLGREFSPILVHSEMPDVEQKVAALRKGEHRVAVCVNMLGEGFDLPELKIAAVHDMHRSLAILLQFTGRFTRTSGRNIGDATVVANIADTEVSGALEKLYSEDADWNELLSEMSSQAAREHAELIEFLAASKRLDEEEEDEISISHQLLRPPLSTLIYEADAFRPKAFYAALPESLQVQRAWLNEETDTLFFVTQFDSKLRWTRSEEIRDRTWSLFILHYDRERKLLFLSSTDHSSLFDGLANEVGATRLISGDAVFRSLGRINRLIFQNMGMKKHGRRNLSFASYTGADVAIALGLSEKAGSVKNNVSGTGWEDGARVAIGCSLKGRVWSREQGSIPAFVRWCEKIGDKLQDDTIDTKEIIANVLIPTEVDALPKGEVLGIEWPVELLGQSEERISLSQGADDDGLPLFLFDLKLDGIEHTANKVIFSVCTEDAVAASFSLTIGGPLGFKVEQHAGAPMAIKAGSRATLLADYLSDYPPLVRFVDLSELDGNLLIAPQNPDELVIPRERFEAWDWSDVDIKIESMWKNGEKRPSSIQAKVAEHYIDAKFDVVFDDDSAGEAADLVCLKEEADHIRLALVHCKFSGGSEPGERVKDVVEVCSQAVRSAKWKWKFRDLCKHLAGRESRLATAQRPTRFLAGRSADLSRFAKTSRFKEIRPEILIVQPGISVEGLTPDQSLVLAAALTYLKETIGVDLDVICGADPTPKA